MLVWLVACHVASSDDSSTDESSYSSLPCQGGSIAALCASGCPTVDELAASCAQSAADTADEQPTWTCKTCGDLTAYWDHEYLGGLRWYVRDGAIVGLDEWSDSPQFCDDTHISETWGLVDTACTP